MLALTMVFLTAGALNAQAHREIELFGLRIYEPGKVIAEAGVSKLPAAQQRTGAVTAAIEHYYHTRGYTLAKAFLIEETPKSLKLFVDEGRIEKIVYRRLNAIDVVKMRYRLSLDHDVYNEMEFKARLEFIRQRFDFKRVYAEVRPVRDYDKSFFQINRPLEIPLLGKAQLPFFEQYPPRYDLNVFFETYAPQEKKGFRYGIRTSYSKGFIPYVAYDYPSLISEGDLLSTKVSAGIYYGFDLKFARPPHWTFMELSSNYSFTPTLQNYFTPMVRGYAYRSWSSRSDIGIEQYEYLILRGTLEPGVTLLKKLKIYAGYGGERVETYNSRVDTGASYIADIEAQVDYWNFFEVRAVLDLIPWNRIRPITRNIKTVYAHYRNGRSFNVFQVTGNLDFEFPNFDIYSLNFDSTLIWPYCPFYYEVAVDGDTFKGFMGKSYHSRRIARVSNEYQISVYRDYIYTGIFFDYTAFEGSGYDLTGTQQGIAYGVGGHFIVFDQFEINVYFGRDHLFSTGEEQYNINLSAHKKW